MNIKEYLQHIHTAQTLFDSAIELLELQKSDEPFKEQLYALELELIALYKRLFSGPDQNTLNAEYTQAVNEIGNKIKACSYRIYQQDKLNAGLTMLTRQFGVLLQAIATHHPELLKSAPRDYIHLMRIYCTPAVIIEHGASLTFASGLKVTGLRKKMMQLAQDFNANQYRISLPKVWSKLSSIYTSVACAPKQDTPVPVSYFAQNASAWLNKLAQHLTSNDAILYGAVFITMTHLSQQDSQGFDDDHNFLYLQMTKLHDFTKRNASTKIGDRLILDCVKQLLEHEHKYNVGMPKELLYRLEQLCAYVEQNQQRQPVATYQL